MMGWSCRLLAPSTSPISWAHAGARRRISPEPAALQLTRRADLLELELPEPDLSIYDRDPGDDDENTP